MMGAMIDGGGDLVGASLLVDGISPPLADMLPGSRQVSWHRYGWLWNSLPCLTSSLCRAYCISVVGGPGIPTLSLVMVR